PRAKDQPQARAFIPTWGARADQPDRRGRRAEADTLAVGPRCGAQTQPGGRRPGPRGPGKQKRRDRVTAPPPEGRLVGFAAGVALPTVTARQTRLGHYGRQPQRSPASPQLTSP